MMKGQTMLPINGAVETPVGRLAFEGGYPSQETVEKLYDRLDFQRAVQAYLWAIPLVSFAQWHEVHDRDGLDERCRLIVKQG